MIEETWGTKKGDTMKKVDELKVWLRLRKCDYGNYIETSKIIKWGSLNYYNRALRTTQEFAERGEIVRRVTRKEQEAMGIESRELMFEIL